MIVVDTNVIAYLLVEGEYTSQAGALWQRNPGWCVPSLWRHEFLNVLSTYVKAGGMDLPGARQLWYSAVRLCEPMESAVDMAEALEWSMELAISAFDAQFVVLARSLGVPLVSEDRRLRRRCPETVMSIGEYLKR